MDEKMQWKRRCNEREVAMRAAKDERGVVARESMTEGTET